MWDRWPLVLLFRALLEFSDRLDQVFQMKTAADFLRPLVTSEDMAVGKMLTVARDGSIMKRTDGVVECPGQVPARWWMRVCLVVEVGEESDVMRLDLIGTPWDGEL